MQTDIKFILVAEDDADDRYLLEMAFRDNGYQEKILFVKDGDEVISTLIGLPPDELPQLVVLDLNMPRKGGKQTLREIRANRMYDSIPVIILSTTNIPEEKAACANIGAMLFLTKPSNYTSLLQTVSLIHSKVSMT